MSRYDFADLLEALNAGYQQTAIAADYPLGPVRWACEMGRRQR